MFRFNVLGTNRRPTDRVHANHQEMHTCCEQLWRHVGDGAIGAGVHRLRAQRPAQPKVCHLCSEAPLVGIVSGQQDVAAG